MGTNYYARIIPTHERREKLKRMIDDDDFRSVEDEVSEMYGKVSEFNINGSIVHLGKKSYGWQFLWENNHYRIKSDDEWVVHKYYDLNKESIRDFLSREDVIIYDEYGNSFSVDEFINETGCFEKNPTNRNGKPLLNAKRSVELETEDSVSILNFWRYEYKNHYAEMFTEMGYNVEYGEIYSDGLRFTISHDFS